MVLRVVVDDYNAGVNDGFDIDAFRANMNDGFHKTAHFNMAVTTPLGLIRNLVPAADPNRTDQGIDINDTLKKLSFNIEATELPGVSIATDEVRKYGIGNFERVPYVTTFKELDVTVRSDAEGHLYHFFQSWMKLVVNFDVRAGIRGASLGFRGAETYEVSYKSEYVSQASVVTYKGDGTQNIHIMFNNLYPIYLSPTSLNWNDNNIVKFQVKFAYSEWNMALNLTTTPINPPK